MIMTRRASVFILAHPGPLRDGLRALLLAMPEVEWVVEHEDAVLAVQELARSHPHLALVDAESFGGHIRGLLDEVRRVSPTTRRIALAGTVDQIRDLETPLAELFIVHGTSAAEVAAAIQRLAAPAAASHLTEGEL